MASRIVQFLLALTIVFQMGPRKGQAADQPVADKLPPGLEKLIDSDTPLRENDRIAFFGDSVTMQGGYIREIEAAIQQSPHTKNLHVTLLKHGLNGGRVPTVLEGKSPWGDLGAPMESLIEKEKPTVVVIYLGINDVWHGEKGTNEADFEAGLRKMTAMCVKAGATTVLCTPSVIGEETQNNKLNDKLGEYAGITAKLAAEEKLTLCDLHTAFLDELKKINPDNKHSGNLTYDGAHMKPAGNDLLADKISEALNIALQSRAKSASPDAQTRTVRVIYLVSSDRQPRDVYRNAVDFAIHDLQKWYRKQLGSITFKLHDPVVEIVHSQKPAKWFSGHSSGGAKDGWFFQNALSQATALVGAKQNDPDYIWVIYSDGPGNTGRGGSGVCCLPEDDLLGLIGKHPTQPDKLRWIAGLGHELGHAFGLAHPKDKLKDADAIMWAGIYGKYPDKTYLTEEDKEILRKSPFFFDSKTTN
jgi:lysophospholipase L1-like esterase